MNAQAASRSIAATATGHSADRGMPFTRVYDSPARPTGTIRSLDYWVGVPLCALLTALRAVLPERRQPPRRILFLNFIERGATVLAQDAIARATRRVGRDQIYFCVFESNRAI